MYAEHLTHELAIVHLTYTTHTCMVFSKYADEEYPGEVTSIEDSDIEVSVMHKSVNAWKWPRPEDKIFYPATQIVRVFNPPTYCCWQSRTVCV